MVGTVASIMSSTIVNVAIPDLSQHFALGQERAQWISSSFMLAMTSSMLTTPWLLGRYGYRGVYVGTMVLLMVGGVAGMARGPLVGPHRPTRPGSGLGRRAGHLCADAVENPLTIAVA